MDKIKRYFYKHRPFSYISVILLIMLFVYMNKVSNLNKIQKHHITFISFFGQEIKLKPNVYVYDINLESATLKEGNNGCNAPYVVTLDKTASKVGSYTKAYFEEGKNQGYLNYNICNYDEKNKEYDCLNRYVFNIVVDSPIESECN